MKLVAEVARLVRSAIADIREHLLGFLADAQTLCDATQLAQLQRHTIDKVGVFGGHKVFEQVLSVFYLTLHELANLQ